MSVVFPFEEIEKQKRSVHRNRRPLGKNDDDRREDPLGPQRGSKRWRRRTWNSKTSEQVRHPIHRHKLPSTVELLPTHKILPLSELSKVCFHRLFSLSFPITCDNTNLFAFVSFFFKRTGTDNSSNNRRKMEAHRGDLTCVCTRIGDIL